MSITFGNIIDMARRTIATPQIDSDGENGDWGDYMPDTPHESARRRTMGIVISDRIDEGEPVYRKEKAS